MIIQWTNTSDSMNKETKNNIEHAIEESGFPFENLVSTKLREHGWTIIPNRFYLDDVKGIEREIDILAYKSSHNKKEDICFYTSLIISCKKSSKNKWCFLTRDSDNNDVNVNYFPFHFLTDDARLKYMTYSEMSSIEEQYKADQQIKKLYHFPKSIISYQILNDKSFIKNEAMYDSIVTSIKALESEKSNLLKKRRGSNESYKRYYSFNLLSLFDGDMIDCNFDPNGVVTYSDISAFQYLNRHIVNKEEHFYSVHFVSKGGLEKALSSYDALAKLNFKIFLGFVDIYYKDIFKNDEKVKLLWDSFVEKTSYTISYTVSKKISQDVDIKLCLYKYEDGVLTLDIGWYDNIDYNEVYNVLNDKKSFAYKKVKECLETMFRYTGNFEFGNALPF